MDEDIQIEVCSPISINAYIVVDL